jgi:arylsulfatase A-like enzyme
MKSLRLAALSLVLLAQAAPAAETPRNAVIFVADGLRYDSVTPKTAPTFWRIRKEGVDFTNSHSLFPTLTTANASAIATGHYLGDTGDYANTLYVGYPVKASGSPIVFLEDDAILADIKNHFGAGYLGQPSLLARARAQGFITAAIGKAGPTLIQDIGATATDAIVLDDSTGKTNSGGTISKPLVNDELAKRIAAVTGLDRAPNTAAPNIVQQSYLATAAARAVLPYLKSQGKPFVLLFWSRDPDATQHASPDKIGSLVPGINGITPQAAIANADSSLKVLLDALARLGLTDSTDVFVTADHGFSTIAKGPPDAEGEMASPDYPRGFVALDVARALGQKIFNPHAGNAEIDPQRGGRSSGDAFIGPSAEAPMAAVAANGGASFVYVLGSNPKRTAKRIFDAIVEKPYVGALFVNDALLKGHKKDFAGALPMSAVNLIGAAKVPQPSIVIGFRSFVAKGCQLTALLCAATVLDTPLKTGQGMHGSFSRADTRNFMAAIGPDFKQGYADAAPVSNADIVPTLAHVLGIPPEKGHGTLKGRIASEALADGAPVKAVRSTLASPPGRNGFRTVLRIQQVGETRYFDAGGDPNRTVGLQP